MFIFNSPHYFPLVYTRPERIIAEKYHRQVQKIRMKNLRQGMNRGQKSQRTGWLKLLEAM
ncbi:MAG: hypothetical protein ACR5LG_11190 [Sodalis sp. (in: enterobacteria)]